jgi:tetratricopeptide (TPR) repeat protein
MSPFSLRPSCLLVAAALGLVAPVRAQDHEHADHEVVGTVHFPTSCNAAAQERFDLGVAKLHSFWFESANEEFAAAAAADPGCAMAHWGTAMTLWGNPMARVSPSEDQTGKALAALEQAEALAVTATPREQAYIEAVAALWRDHESVGFLDRMRAHEEGLQAVVAANPEDTEAAIFYARMMVANADPADLTFERQQRAAEILLPLFEAQPQHPGLAHYIIHAFDAPPIAGEGLEAAQRYAEIAPAAPHALHMPSHIFTRLGYWDESIETNRRSAEASPEPNAAVHPLDYMVYAYLQEGRDAAAQEVIGRIDYEEDRFYGGVQGFNAQAMPARYALERGDWAAAAMLPVPEGDALAYVEAIPRFARAVGAARSGQPEMARGDVDRLKVLEDDLAQSGEEAWAVRVGAQRLAAESWVLWAEGDRAGALELAGRAADLEETVEKHPITPGPLLPARELQADMLLESGDAAGARAAYEATLVREPRRARALYGAAVAAQRAGDEPGARLHAEELLELMDRADPTRPEPAWARGLVPEPVCGAGCRPGE